MSHNSQMGFAASPSAWQSSQPSYPHHGGTTNAMPPKHAAGPRALEDLAQEYARKLRRAGYSVAQGVDALSRPGCAQHPGAADHSAPASDVGQVESVAQRIFGDGWTSWFENPCPLLGGESPKSAMKTFAGRAKVRRLLQAYENAG
ncbi:MAG: DUF2384 domain-containing protein [Comamonadaceae bacterium]|nr:MAG: DUF2384 domain-containing protein [Comamonadaceae bacterium]